MTNRRDLIKKSVLGTACLTIGGIGFSSKSYASIIGSNERVNIAVIGIRGQGQAHIQSYSALANVRVTALCDVDSNLFATIVKNRFTDKGLPNPKIYTDMRKLYEDKDIDAVSIVTPNHWRALASIWALQAGKHVSVEKPCCYNFFAGKKLVEAAEKYKLIVQDGAEQRSNPCSRSMASGRRWSP